MDEFDFERSAAPQTKQSMFSLPMVLLTLGICIAILAGAFAIRHLAQDLPSTAQIENYSMPFATKIYDKNGNLIDRFSNERRYFVAIKDVPANLKNAFMAIEDNDFYNHWGISIRGTTRALSRIFIRGDIREGGSTFTQQLSRSIFLTTERTAVRKIKEALLTIQLEKLYSKDEIFQFYMNQIYFGKGAYGIEAAANTYFGKSVTQLTLGECAMLAGIPKAPNNYNPFSNLERSTARRNLVLRRMRELGYITRQQEKEAQAEKVLTRDEVPDASSTRRYVGEYIRILLAQKYGTDVLYNSGYSVYTTIDMEIQNAAEQALDSHLTEFDKKRLPYFNSRKMTPVKVQGAVIVMDAQTGAIRAMVGGRDFKETQFNRATQALRQPGSSFKPFVYLAAIQRGWTAATIVKDNPMIFFLDPQTRKWSLMADDMDSLEEFAQTHPESNLSDTNKVWAPSNYGGKFRGDITLRTALALSINMSVVETIAKIGPAAVVSAARSLGITTPLLETYTLALGAGEVTLQEMVGAYAVFASGGIKNEPFIITKITKESTDKNVQSEQIIEEHIPTPTRVISPQVAFVMTNMLRSVVERGTGYRARQLGRPVAAKTGTSNDETDAWFIGYTADYVAGVWVGYDEQKIVLGAGATGGTLAAPIWVDFMKVAENNLPVKNFVQPDGIEWQYIDPRTGFIAPAQSPGAYREAFIRGTAPRQFSTRGSSYISDDLLEESGGF